MKIDKIRVLILVFLALAGYFVWAIFHKPAGPKSEQVFIPSANYNIKTPVSNPAKTDGEPPFSQEKQLYKPADEAVMPFFENINETAKTTEIKLKNEIDTATQGVPASSADTKIATSMPNEITFDLTDDEFHFLYPDTFIKSLIDAQNLFVKNLDPSYEPLVKIETDAQVRLIEEKIVAALVSMNMLTKEEGGWAITTIRYTLPKMQLIDLRIREQISWNRYFNFPIPAKSLSIKTSLFGLIEMLRNTLMRGARAGYCGECHSLPECYQVGSSSPTPGANIFKVFCACSGCYYGQGCLDSCSGGSAIFDQTNFICGCGY